MGHNGELDNISDMSLDRDVRCVFDQNAQIFDFSTLWSEIPDYYTIPLNKTFSDFEEEQHHGVPKLY